MDLLRTYSSSTDKSSDHDSPTKNFGINQNITPSNTPSKPRLNLVEQKLKKTIPTPGPSQKNVDINVNAAQEYGEKVLKNECTCKLNCSQKIPTDKIQSIRKSFQSFDLLKKNAFIREYVIRFPVKRRRVNNKSKAKKIYTFQYFLMTNELQKERVCQTFFLFAIGYKPCSSKAIYQAFGEEDDPVSPDRRGKYKRDLELRTAMLQHINSYEPVESHYRRNHAPLARYLPSDLNKANLFGDWKTKRENLKAPIGSFTLYRKLLKELNIRFVQPKQEDCEDCLSYFQHETQSNHSRHNLNENSDIKCDHCKYWFEHIQLAAKSRALYNQYKQNCLEVDTIAVSVDLEKVSLFLFIFT